jgi:hypothetical protein
MTRRIRLVIWISCGLALLAALALEGLIQTLPESVLDRFPQPHSQEALDPRLRRLGISLCEKSVSLWWIFFQLCVFSFWLDGWGYLLSRTTSPFTRQFTFALSVVFGVVFSLIVAASPALQLFHLQGTGVPLAHAISGLAVLILCISFIVPVAAWITTIFISGFPPGAPRDRNLIASGVASIGALLLLNSALSQIAVPACIPTPRSISR